MPKNSEVDLDDDVEIRREIKLALLDILRNAKKRKRIYFECDQHPAYTGNGRGYKHEHVFYVEDSGARINAAKEILNRLEGTPGVRKERAAPKTSGRALEELTDEELIALIDETKEED